MGNRGYSLIEILLAITLISVLVFATMGVSKYSATISNFSNLQSSLADVTDRMSVALASRSNCEMNLRKLSISTDPAITTAVTLVKGYDSSRKVTTVIADTNDKSIPNFSIQSMKIVPKTAIATGQILADLTVEASGDIGQTTTRRIPILVDVSKGKIDSCISQFDPNTSIQAAACSINSDGGNEWNFNDNECEDTRPHQQVVGDYTTVSCPAGWTADWCWSNEPPGWVDPVRGVPRQYQDGSTQSTAPPPYSCDTINSTTCKCSYDTSVSTTGFTAAVDCVQ